MIHAEIQISLGRSDIRMPHHLLDCFQICPVLHQMGRKRMADRVRRDIRLNAGLCRVLLDELPEVLTAG